MDEGFEFSPRAMRHFVRQFKHQHPECADPTLVQDRCMDYCAKFLDYLESKRWPIAATIISGVRYGEFMGTKVVIQGHFAVLHAGVVYDWTARQFDPDAPVPKITPLAQWQEEWQPLSKETE